MPPIPLLLLAHLACSDGSIHSQVEDDAGQVVATISCGSIIEVREAGAVIYRLSRDGSGWRATDRSGRVVLRVR